jgi:Peptidase A4 family
MSKIHRNNGTTIRTFAPPPPGFDPLKADAATLALHGAPPRPVGNAKLLARWEKVMRRFTHYVEPTLEPGRHKLIRPDVTGTVTSSDYLPVTPGQSGAAICGIDMTTPSNPFNAVSAEFTVPTISLVSPATDDGCIFAVSIGRFGDFPLIAGVMFYLTFGDVGGGQQFYKHYQAFLAMGYQHPFDILMSNGQPYPVNAGDVVTMMIGYGYMTDGEVTFSMMGPAGATSVSVSPPQGFNFDGNDAAFTIETWATEDGSATMPNFGTVYFSQCTSIVSCGSGGGGLPYTPTTGNSNLLTAPHCSVQVIDGDEEVECQYM